MGLAKGAGWRGAKRKGGHGGKRTKKPAPDPEQWWYPGVQAVREAFVEASWESAAKRARMA